MNFHDVVGLVCATSLIALPPVALLLYRLLAKGDR